MPTVAEEQIAEVAQWFVDSSQARVSPMKDPWPIGAYGAVLPVGIDENPLPDLASIIADEALVLLTPQAAPPPDLNAAPNISSRAMHTLWKIEQAHLPGVIVVGLPSRDMSVRDALNAEGLAGVSLAERGVLAVPLYAFPSYVASKIAAELPLV